MLVFACCPVPCSSGEDSALHDDATLLHFSRLRFGAFQMQSTLLRLVMNFFPELHGVGLGLCANGRSCRRAISLESSRTGSPVTPSFGA